MTHIMKVLAAMILVFALSSLAQADDGPTITFTLDMEFLTVSMEGVGLRQLHDPETEKMLKRAAQLARYAACEMVRRDDPSPCSRFLE